MPPLHRGPLIRCGGGGRGGYDRPPCRGGGGSQLVPAAVDQPQPRRMDVTVGGAIGGDAGAFATIVGAVTAGVRDGFLVDSGASVCLVRDTVLLHDVKPAPNGLKVQGVSGAPFSPTLCGTMCFR